MSGPVLIVDERGVYPSSLDRAVEEQRRYYARARCHHGNLPPCRECDHERRS